VSIIDFSVARPSLDQLKTSGVTTVMRYIGWDGVGVFPNTGKNLTKAEADRYLSAGISIGLAFEYTASAAALGSDQGSKDGQLAKDQLSQVGAPIDAGVYFAVDYDTPDYAPGLANTSGNSMAKLGPIGQYFKAINDLRGGYRVGAYGGYWVIKRLFDCGLITLGWQTIAWSGGNVDSRISLLQTVDKSPIAGSDMNIHQSKQADFGQWPSPAPVTKPTPPATPGSMTVDIPPGTKGFTITWH
jgi:Domain of unknown function (DUF1906)